MKNVGNMKGIIKGIIGVIVFILLIRTVAFTTGCNFGGTNIRLENVSLGTVTMEGRPIEGLPSDKVNLLLNVSAQEIKVAPTASGSILTLSPSGATIEINSSVVSIMGLGPEHIKVEWVVSQQD